MKFSTQRRIHITTIALFSTATMLLFQNCANYQGSVSTYGLDSLKAQNSEGNLADSNNSFLPPAPIIDDNNDVIDDGGNYDNPPIHIDPVDPHTGVNPVPPTDLPPIPPLPPGSDPVSSNPPPPSDGSGGNNNGGGTVVLPPDGNQPPVVDLPVVPPQPPVVVTPPVIPPTIPPVLPQPPVVVTPPVVPPVTPLPPVVVNPPPPVVAPPVFSQPPISILPVPISNPDDYYEDRCNRQVVVSSDGQAVVSSDGQVVVYGDGECPPPDAALNCGYFAQNFKNKNVFSLSHSKHNNASLQIDSKIKMIMYNGAEPLYLKAVNTGAISICGNIKIESLNANGSVELTQVQVAQGNINGNLTSYKMDQGFRVVASKKKAGTELRNCRVNSKYQIIAN